MSISRRRELRAANGKAASTSAGMRRVPKKRPHPRGVVSTPSTSSSHESAGGVCPLAPPAPPVCGALRTSRKGGSHAAAHSLRVVKRARAGSGGQGVHQALPSVEETSPAAHSSQRCAPSPLKLPAGHGSHLVAALAFECVPAAHGEHPPSPPLAL